MGLKDESLYLAALVALNKDNFDEKLWLVEYSELYLTTLNWPEGLPHITNSSVMEGSLQNQFRKVYAEILRDYPHREDHERGTIVFWGEIS